MSASECAADRDKDKREKSEWLREKSSLEYRQLYHFICLYRRAVFSLHFLALLPSLRCWFEHIFHSTYFFLPHHEKKDRIVARCVQYRFFVFAFASFYITRRFNDLRNKNYDVSLSWQWRSPKKKRIQLHSPRKMICMRYYSFSTYFSQQIRYSILCAVKLVIVHIKMMVMLIHLRTEQKLRKNWTIWINENT